LRLFGPEPGERSVPLLSLVSEKETPGELALELGRRGIAARPGLHCAPSAHGVLGTLDRGGTLRLSPGFLTGDEDIELALSAFKEILA